MYDCHQEKHHQDMNYKKDIRNQTRTDVHIYIRSVKVEEDFVMPK